MSCYFGDKTWVEIEEYVKQQAVVILPIGTTEEHGHHLPVATDALIAQKFGDEMGKALEGKLPVLVMETIQYGFSMSIVRNWPGCPNIDTRTFADYIFNITDSLVQMGFKKIVMLDCHGNHDCLLRLVMREIADKHDIYMMTLAPFSLCADLYKKIRKDPEGDIHGGEWETSLVLAIDESLVKTDLYTNVDAIRCNSILRGPVSTWGLQKTKTGLFGDPTYATKELGEAMIEEGTRNGVKYIEEYYHHKFE
ncbi:creatininase family protein [Christensenellaceae bacterium OttesenSCG-928-M15]|nr:creatininase family protein [Christensenellaceae bacterium OttesenSCG-928-M15]